MLAFVNEHPSLATAGSLMALLAVVGIWYLITHHAQAIAVALLSAVGTAAGADILYHGATEGFRRLVLEGVFLLLVFPLVFYYAMVLARRSPGVRARPPTPAAPSPRKPAA